MDTTILEQSALAEVSLSDIQVSTTNREFFRGSNDFSEVSLRDITESIRQNGVITPILLRPSPTKGQYVLVAGERRYHGSLLAGKKTIPAYIKPMSDEQAFSLQMIENIEREDVHPMKECIGYHHILKDPAQSPKEIALRFGKSESYVVQRLKLIDLVPAARKAFEKDHISLSQAILLARLTQETQKEYLNGNRWDDDRFGSLSELQRFINHHVIHSLKDAPFNTEDETLFPKAGACSLCPKRSGCSPALFADIKAKDRCIDYNCFNTKTEAHHLRELTRAIDSGKDLVFIRSYTEPSEPIQQILDERGIKTLKEYDDFNGDKTGTKAKGFWVSGNNTGTLTTIYLKAKIKGSHGNEPVTTKVEIAKIQQRVKRSAELDDEKVYAKILEAMRKHPSLKATKKMVTEEEAFAWFIIYDKAGYSLKRTLDRVLKVPSDPTKAFKFFSTLTSEQKGHLIRNVMMDQYGGNYPTTIYANMLRKIAESYKDIPISEFEKEQLEIRTKREDRAKQRIKTMKQQGA